MPTQRVRRQPGQQPSSPSFLGDDIRVECFMLCDAVEPVNQRLYILGGGLDAVSIPGGSDPVATGAFVVAARLVAPSASADKEFRVVLESLGPDGDTILPPLDISVQFSRDPSAPGSPASANLAIAIARLPVTTSGGYRFVLSTNGRSLAETSLDVLLAPIDDRTDARP